MLSDMNSKLNYAALLALLALVSFSMPFLVSLAENAGVPRSYSIILSLTLALWVGLYLYIRWQQGRLPKAPIRPDSLPDEPYVEVFFRNGVFQGQWLLEQGETEAALAVYRAYQAILLRHGHAGTSGETQDTLALRQTIVDLEKLREDAVSKASKAADITKGDTSASV